MEQKKLKWKDIYNQNKNRRYCKITGIQKEGISLESNSFKIIKEKKYISIISIIIILAILIWTFRSNIKMLIFVLAFFLIAGIGFFVFNYFKFTCSSNGLYVKFGFQEGNFSYDRLKCVYLSKFNDYSFLLPTKRVYSIVIRYIDNYNRIRELSFPNYFLKVSDTMDFLNNFNIEEAEEERYVQYERFKILKMIGKSLIAIFIVVFIISLFVLKLGR